MTDLKVAMAQINTVVGDIQGNRDKIIDYIAQAKDRHADICVFPELSLTGYPPLDLIFDTDFIDQNMQAMASIIKKVNTDMVVIVGYICRKEQNLHNSLAVIQNKTHIARVDKTLLPTYDVFDEDRYFKPSRNPHPVDVMIHGEKLSLGIEVCEDLWDDGYDMKVTRQLVNLGAQIIINASASPYNSNKLKWRHDEVKAKVAETGVPFVYNNLVGGQDELIFDGKSFIIDKNGKFALRLSDCKEELGICQLNSFSAANPLDEPDYNEFPQQKNGLVLGIQDYFYKNGFKDAVLGLSGGVDSALVAALAVEALGKDHVYAYAMPSHFSSDHSLNDAAELAKNLGLHYDVIPIKPTFDSFMSALEKSFAGTESGLAEENLQARIRGGILMSISNKYGALVLTTGNKTEIALGYCTLYGDMCGALAPISDLNKGDVYALCEYINSKAGYDLIPQHIISKLPSAELAEDQYDPFDYDIVSPLVEDILENKLSMPQIEKKYKDVELIRKLDRLIQMTEFKRQQSAPGLKVTSRAFGQGRRMPLVNRFNRYVK